MYNKIYFIYLKMKLFLLEAFCLIKNSTAIILTVTVKQKNIMQFTVMTNSQ